MPRRNRQRRDDPRPARPVHGVDDRESAPDGDWIVRPVTGAAALKAYRCPGCDHEIPPGQPHVVTWDADGRVEDRRHWHRACWDNRGRRRIARRR